MKIVSKAAARLRQRHVFQPVDQPVFELIPISPDAILRCSYRVASPDRQGCLGIFQTQRGDRIVVIVHGKRAVQINSEYGWPEVTARWINSKLVHVQRYFNPFFGHYCIYDAHARKVILEEFITDGREIEAKQLDALAANQPLPAFLAETNDPAMEYAHGDE
jgi:hypothetical protein